MVNISDQYSSILFHFPPYSPTDFMCSFGTIISIIFSGILISSLRTWRMKIFYFQLDKRSGFFLQFTEKAKKQNEKTGEKHESVSFTAPHPYQYNYLHYLRLHGRHFTLHLEIVLRKFPPRNSFTFVKGEMITFASFRCIKLVSNKMFYQEAFCYIRLVIAPPLNYQAFYDIQKKKC